MNMHPDPTIWDEILAHLRRYHPDRCRQWFEEVAIASLAGGVLTLSASQPVQLRYLQAECVEIFREAAQSVTGRLLSVVFVSSDEAAMIAMHPQSPAPTPPRRPQQTTPPVVPPKQPPMMTNGVTHAPASAPSLNGNGNASPNGRIWGTLYDEMVINPDYSFETYIVGPNNRLAHAAAVAVSQQPGTAYNPFFIHSGVGLGKTHLLQAICQALLSTKPDCRIYYVSCEGFVGQFMEAVQAGQMLEFRHKFRDIDVLVVDDIHFLAAHERTQEEFFHTFNSLWQSRKQIVLSSDASPNEIPKLEDRLLSRFKCGLVARMDKPCYETRLAILKIKARLRGLVLPDDVLCYVAHHTDSNIRELEGALTQLQATAMAMSRIIDLEMAREALGDAPTPLTPIVNIQAIISTVARQFEVKQTDLFSKRRQKSIALPRQVAMYLARCHTSHSLQEIGGFFGGRDHTTVMHAVKRIGKLRASDAGMDRRLDMIERDLAIRIS